MAENAVELTPELRLAQQGVFEKLEKISAGLKAHDPMVEMHCKHIRQALSEHEELVHLLSDEQAQTLFAGMKSYINVQLVKEASKTRSKGKVTADDL